MTPKDQLAQVLAEIKNKLRSELLCCACLTSLALHEDFHCFTGLEPETPLPFPPRVVFWDGPVAGASIMKKSPIHTKQPGEVVQVRVGFTALCCECANSYALTEERKYVPRLLFFIAPLNVDGVTRQAVFYHRVDSLMTTEQVGELWFNPDQSPNGSAPAGNLVA